MAEDSKTTLSPAEERKRLSSNEDALKAYNAAIEAAKTEMAKKIKENRASVAQLLEFSKPDDLTDDTIATIANDYVEHGKFKIKNTEYTRQSLLSKVGATQKDAAEFFQDMPTLGSFLGVQADAASLIPTQAQLTHPAKRIAQSVEENTGWMSKIGFAIKGFFNWLKDIFDGGERKGLMEHINMVAADSIARSTHDKLAGDMQKDPALGNALGGQTFLRNTQQAAYEGVMAARGGATTTAPSLKDSLKNVAPLPSADTQKWTNQEATRAQQEVKKSISGMVERQVKQLFNPDKNKEFWETIAKNAQENYKKAHPIKSLITPSSYFTPEAVARTVENAIGGGKPDQASKLLGDAIAEGALQHFKDMDANAITAALNNPNSTSLAENIANKTFQTDDWKKIEANIRADNEIEDKDGLIKRMKNAVKEKIGTMIDEKKGAITKATTLSDKIIDMQQKWNTIKTINALDQDGNQSLSLNELQFLDQNHDGKISQSELATLPDNLRKQFEELMKAEKNKSFVGKDGSLDFTASPPSTPNGPKKPAGLSLGAPASK